MLSTTNCKYSLTSIKPRHCTVRYIYIYTCKNGTCFRVFQFYDKMPLPFFKEKWVIFNRSTNSHFSGFFLTSNATKLKTSWTFSLCPTPRPAQTEKCQRQKENVIRRRFPRFLSLSFNFAGFCSKKLFAKGKQRISAFHNPSAARHVKNKIEQMFLFWMLTHLSVQYVQTPQHKAQKYLD